MSTDADGRAEPQGLAAARRAADRLAFTMSCSEQTGPLVALLASIKSASGVLEVGTGVGYGTTWLTSGMGPDAPLTTIEIDQQCLGAARTTVGSYERGTLIGVGHTASGRLGVCEARPLPSEYRNLGYHEHRYVIGTWT